MSRGSRNLADRDRQRPLLRDGSRQTLGPRRDGPIGSSSMARARPPPTRRQAVEAAYQRGETDEFVRPTAIGGLSRNAGWRRSVDRQFPRRPGARDRGRVARSGRFPGLRAPGASTLPLRSGSSNIRPSSTNFLATLFPPENLDDTFGEVVSHAGLTQLRIAETEKYAHVTFFL